MRITGAIYFARSNFAVFDLLFMSQIERLKLDNRLAIALRFKRSTGTKIATVKKPQNLTARSIVIFCITQIANAAAPIDGWYAGALGGYAYVPGNIKNTHLGLYRSNARYQSGFDAGGFLGFKSNPMRYEGEISYLKANINSFRVNEIKQTHPSGYNQAMFGLANVYYDFPGIIAVLEPFLGVGIGYAWVQAKLDSTGPNGNTRFTESNTVFAYQGTAGLTYNFAENYALNIAYRYVATNHMDELGQHFQAHLANVGALYRFDGNNYK